jgi:hypothetical protein
MGSSAKGAAGGRIEPYEFEPINAAMGLDILIDIPIRHPLRHHHEMVLVHRDSQQR